MKRRSMNHHLGVMSKTNVMDFLRRVADETRSDFYVEFPPVTETYRRGENEITLTQAGGAEGGMTRGEDKLHMHIESYLHDGLHAREMKYTMIKLRCASADTSQEYMNEVIASFTGSMD